MASGLVPVAAFHAFVILVLSNTKLSSPRLMLALAAQHTKLLPRVLLVACRATRCSRSAPAAAAQRQKPLRATRPAAAAAAGRQQQAAETSSSPAPSPTPQLAPQSVEQQQQQQQQQEKKKQSSAAGMAPDSDQQGVSAQPGGEQPGQQQQRRPKLWWKERPSFRCPACGQCCFKVPNFEAHILRCCPDVALPDEWRELLARAEAEAAAAPEAAAAAAGQQQQDGAPDAAHEQQAQRRHAHEVPAALVRHPADAAIRTWLDGVVEPREQDSRRRAVSGRGAAGTAVPAMASVASTPAE